MKRRLSAIFCALALLVLCAVPAAPALEGEALRAADTLASLDLVQGDGAGYALEAPTTRAQAAVLLVRLSGTETAGSVKSPFQDVPAWAEEALACAVVRGWIPGEDAFRPEEAVSLDDWCAWLLRMLGYWDSLGDFSPAAAATFARHIGLLTRDYESPLKRGDLFQILRDALTFSYKGGGETVIQRLVSRGRCEQTLANALGLFPTELTARQAADRCMAAVFCLRTFADAEKQREDIGLADASGFFISSDGVAVTNYHSIDKANLAVATLVTGETYPVEQVLYYDLEADIAILKVSRTSLEGETTSAFACLEAAEEDELRVGDTVYAIGSPLGLGLAFTSGIVTATGRVVENYRYPCIMNSADISQGSSGGALMNVCGRVVGVTTGAYAYGNNMYLAVPISAVQTAERLREPKTLEQVTEEVAAARKAAD